jgi:intracellular septation protein A
MSMQKALLGFIPWLVFTAMATRGGVGAVGAAAVLACLVALNLVICSTVRGESVRLLEVIAVVVFGGYALVTLIDPTADTFLAHYGRALAALLLAAVIFVLLPVAPFTEQYARESVPREYWHTPEFRSVNH